jgi:small subunit ribosomal protein S8e
MVVMQKRSKRKSTGGRYKSSKTRRQYEAGSVPTLTKLGSLKMKSEQGLANIRKQRVMVGDKANVLDMKTKTYKVVAIKTIVGNPANKHFVRRNIMTKGAIIDTELGKARVTSRPGQDGTINAVLI